MIAVKGMCKYTQITVVQVIHIERDNFKLLIEWLARSTHPVFLIYFGFLVIALTILFIATFKLLRFLAVLVIYDRSKGFTHSNCVKIPYTLAING